MAREKVGKEAFSARGQLLPNVAGDPCPSSLQLFLVNALKAFGFLNSRSGVGREGRRLRPPAAGPRGAFAHRVGSARRGLGLHRAARARVPAFHPRSPGRGSYTCLGGVKLSRPQWSLRCAPSIPGRSRRPRTPGPPSHCRAPPRRAAAGARAQSRL